MKPRTRRGLAAATTTALTLATLSTLGTAGAASTTVAFQGFESNSTGFSSWMNDSTVARTTTGTRSGTGALAITTKTGGQRFSGNVGYETDEFSGTRISNGLNRLQASLGGPITNDLTFFVGGDISGTRFGNNGIRGWEVPQWRPVGVDTTYAIPKSTSATAERSGCVILKRASATIRNSASALHTISFDRAEGPCLKKGGGVRSRVPSGMTNDG